MKSAVQAIGLVVFNLRRPFLGIKLAVWMKTWSIGNDPLLAEKQRPCAIALYALINLSSPARPVASSPFVLPPFANRV